MTLRLAPTASRPHLVPPLIETGGLDDSARGNLAQPPGYDTRPVRYGRGSLSAARLRIWPPTVRPIDASSPAACTTVVTSSVPVCTGRARGTSSRRDSAFSVGSLSAGEPTRTARG